MGSSRLRGDRPKARALPRRRSGIFALGVAVVLAAFCRTVVAAESSSWQVLLGGDDANTPRMPSGVAVDGQGSVYVTDTSGSRIEKLTASGRLVTTFGHLGPGEDALRRPRGLALDGRGTGLVAGAANHRIPPFRSRGHTPAPRRGHGTEPGEVTRA